MRKNDQVMSKAQMAGIEHYRRRPAMLQFGLGDAIAWAAILLMAGWILGYAWR